MTLSDQQFGKRIYRGEVRKVIPTPEHPDPAAAAQEDPHGLMHTWATEHYPWPKDWNGMELSVGTHWTRSPEVIPERFVEPVLLGKQQGVPLGKRERTAITRRDALEAPLETDSGYDGPDWYDRRQQEVKQQRGHEAYLNRAEKEGVNQWRDLSGGDPDRPGAAKPYNMAVVWEGHLPEDYTPGTNYEDEHDLPEGSKVKVTGARIFVPRSGEGVDYSQRHPTTFTPEERRAATSDTWERSGYSHIRDTTPVPWNRVQFQDAVELPVKSRSPRWGR